VCVLVAVPVIVMVAYLVFVLGLRVVLVGRGFG
jgi:hypothetical protein